MSAIVLLLGNLTYMTTFSNAVNTGATLIGITAIGSTLYVADVTNNRSHLLYINIIILIHPPLLYLISYCLAV